MSPILDLQQRLQEVGRIRMGEKVATKSGGKRPGRLAHFRLTSRDATRLEAAAAVYGGTVQPWAERAGEHELYTEADQLRVIIIPGQALSQWWELWSGGGCTRRCDGFHEVLSDGPCLCKAEYDDKADQATNEKACKATTRLAVLLPDVPGIGHWRLETHSYYAAVELAAANHLIEEATRRGALLPARLRIDQRKKVAGGTTTPYPVPVLDLDVSADDLLQLGPAAAEGEVVQLPQLPPAPAQAPEGHTPVPDAARGGTSLQAGLAGVSGPPTPPAPRSNAAEQLGVPTPPPAATAPLPGPDEDPPPVQQALIGEGAAQAKASEEPQAPPEPPAPEAGGGEPNEPVAAAAAPPVAADAAAASPPPSTTMANQRQRRLLWATVRERSVPEDELRRVLREVTGQESTASIPANLFEAVMAGVQGVQT